MTSPAFPPLAVDVSPDPMEQHTLVTGAYLYDGTRNRELLDLVYAPNRNDWCSATAPESATGGGWGRVCSRATHPPHWRHAASNGDTLLCFWDADEPPPQGGLIDPEDGSDPDSPEVTLTVAEINLGHCYKLRDRANILYVIGGAAEDPRGDDLVEVLDLHKREYRVVPVTYVLPSEHVLTLDELSWVGSYIHKVRNAVRDEAVEQYLNKRWCMSGLNSSLADLGLPKYTPLLRGHLMIKVPFTATNTSAGKSHIETLLKPVFEKLVASAQAPPDNDLGVRLRVNATTVQTSELERK